MTGMRDKTVNNPRATWFEVSGHCMTPLIRKGDLVMAIPVIELRIGDIVIISGSPPIVHRVVRVVKGAYALTKGDMSLRLDPPLTEDNPAGKVIALIRKGNKPIAMEGKLWRIENYLMARYSLACFSAWNWASRHKWITRILLRFSAPVRGAYISVCKVLTRFATIKTG